MKKPELNLVYTQYCSSVSYFARANYANFDINNNQHLPFNNQRIHQTGKRFITEIGAETLYGFQYFDVSIDGLFLHKKYSLDDKEINTRSTSIPSIKIKISSLLRSSSIGSFSLLMPEFIYKKTNYKDQSMDPIFDLHQRNLGNFNRLNTRYCVGKDRRPDTEL